MGASADLQLIKAEHRMQLRYCMALCIIEAQLPGSLHAGSLAVSMTGSDQIRHCQVHQNRFSLLLLRAPTSLDCILSLNCDVAPFADQPGQMQSGHQFSDDPEQGSSDILL